MFPSAVLGLGVDPDWDPWCWGVADDEGVRWGV